MSSHLYTFERWTLDCGRGVLAGANGDIVLRPKSFEVLRFLIENAGRLVSRDEVLDAAWPGVTVTDESLTQCVSEIRQALGDAEQRIVKTLPKRGYLFAAPVSSKPRDDQDANMSLKPAQQQQSSWADPVLPPSTQRFLHKPSVAILPFANLSGNPSQEYLSDGFTEDIINGLSHFSELAVIARNSSFGYKGRAIDARVVGQELGVLYLVEGSVRKFGDRIRITTQLIDATTGVHRWGGRFDRALGEVFAVQDEITQSIVSIVVAHLGNAEAERASRKAPNSWTAYDLTLQGDQAMQAYVTSWSVDKLYEARRLFEEALKVDPTNARICAKLAHTHLRAFSIPVDQDFADPAALNHGYELASRAVRFEPNLPLARAELGWALHWKREPDAAIREFEKALALNPNFSDGRFAAALVYAGQPARALDVVQANLRLNPFHPPYVHAYKGHALYMLRRYGDAVAPLSESIRRSPYLLYAYLWLAATYVRLGRLTEARETAAELANQRPNFALEHWPALSCYQRVEDAEHMIEALRQAGFS